jgi:dTDP-L-rhamnose 4-epimerase
VSSAEKKRVLVTGGAGFIGSFLVDRLVLEGHEVTVFDNLDAQVHTAGKAEYLNPQATLVQGDVRDYEAFRCALSGQQIVYHLAGVVGVGQSQYEIRRYVEVNTLGTANLLDIIVNHDVYVEKLIVAASMSSYGEGCYAAPEHGVVRPPLRPIEQMASGEWEPKCPVCGDFVQPIPTPESAAQNCNSIYAQTKKDQEDMVMNIGRTYSIPAVATRFFNVYGPRQSLSNPYTGVAAIFLSRLKNNRPPVIYEDGLQTRDFISVHDIVDGLLLCMERPEANYEVFNLGSGRAMTVLEVARLLARLSGKDIEPEITRKFRKGDVRHCFADISKAKRLLGWEPKVDFEDGMKELIGWSHNQTATDHLMKAIGELRVRGIV